MAWLTNSKGQRVWQPDRPTAPTAPTGIINQGSGVIGGQPQNPGGQAIPQTTFGNVAASDAAIAASSGAFNLGPAPAAPTAPTTEVSWAEWQKLHPVSGQANLLAEQEKWKASNLAIRTGQIPAITKEEKAQAIVDEERKKQREKEMELYGYYITPESEQAQAEEFTSKAEKKKTALEQQIESMNEQDKLQFQQNVQQGTAAIAGAQAQYAQNVEGVVSQTNPLVAKQFQSTIGDKLSLVRMQMERARNERATQLAALDEAIQSGQQSLAENIRKNLATAENQIDKIQLELSKSEAEANKEAWNIIDKVGIEAFANIDTNTLSAMFPTLEGVQLAGVSYLAQQKQTLKQSDPDYLQKLLNLEKTTQEIKTAGMTESQKDYNFWKREALIDPTGAQAFAKQKGFIPSEADLLDIEQKRANIQKTYDELGYAEPFDSKYAFQETSTGVQWDVPSGITLARGECGEFVNDAIFGSSGYFGNSFTQKMTFDNSDEPVVGGAFIMNTGDYTGHVGLVESIDYNPDGSMKGISIRDSNAQRLLPDGTRVSPKTVDTAYFSVGTPEWNNIEGWFNPATYQGKKTAINQKDEALVNAIMTPGSSQRLENFTTKTKERLAPILSAKKQEALNSGDIYGAMRASAGGVNPDMDFRKTFTKTATVIDQLDTLSAALNNKDTLNKFDASPITGFIKSKNPWSQEGQTINAVLQATVPNLARGVFGEVGVLTDNDIALYRKTLPNLTQPEDIRKSITALTLRTLRNSLNNQIEVAAGSNVNVSGLINFYERLDNKVNDIESELGIKISVQAPNGKIYNIPPNKLKEAKASGGKIIE